MDLEINEELIKKFIKDYKRDYWFGKVMGEDLFVKIFGYLHPLKPFEELKRDDIDFLWKGFMRNMLEKFPLNKS